MFSGVISNYFKRLRDFRVLRGLKIYLFSTSGAMLQNETVIKVIQITTTTY